MENIIIKKIKPDNEKNTEELKKKIVVLSNKIDKLEEVNTSLLFENKINLSTYTHKFDKLYNILKKENKFKLYKIILLVLFIFIFLLRGIELNNPIIDLIKFLFN